MMKTVIVIGASGGIGKQVASDLSAQYSVIVTYLNTPVDIPNAKPYKLDLSDVQAIKIFTENIKNLNIPIYAVINCAGICEYEEGGLENDIDTWNKTMAINLTSNYILAKCFQGMIEENGRFVMISSTDAMYGASITAAYSASKAGVNSLTKSLSLLLKDKKVSVNAVAPGWVDTRMIEGTSEKFLKGIADINPLKRIANPEDISNVITFLLREESEYINGQVLTVDGGYTNQDPTLVLEAEDV